MQNSIGNISNKNNKHYDDHTLYIESGEAKEDQIAECLKVAIIQADRVLGRKTNCKFQINLIMKDGQYVGHGYIRISSKEVYYMMLGFNPDGTPRTIEIPDPDWISPSLKDSSTDLNIDDFVFNEGTLTKKKSWFELTMEEDSKIQPTIKKYLPPLVIIPGYVYDEEQINENYLQEENEDENRTKSEDTHIPTVGHFTLSRAFAYDPPQGYLKYRLCSKNVPDWVPEKAFKSIFSSYVSDATKFATTNFGKKEVTDTYPIVNLIRKNLDDSSSNSYYSSRGRKYNEGKYKSEDEGRDEKKKGNIVLISFDPNNNDAIFALLMTRKLKIIHPSNPELSCVLHFNHAYDPKFTLY